MFFGSHFLLKWSQKQNLLVHIVSIFDDDDEIENVLTENQEVECKENPGLARSSSRTEVHKIVNWWVERCHCGVEHVLIP